MTVSLSSGVGETLLTVDELLSLLVEETRLLDDLQSMSVLHVGVCEYMQVNRDV